VRRWRDGVIADAVDAVASPQRLSDDPDPAHRLLALVDSLPALVWGRDELGTGEMWNSNSVVSWLLSRSGIRVEAISPPAGGRAPGWEAGLVAACLQQPTQQGFGQHPRAARASGAPTARLGAVGRSPTRVAASSAPPGRKSRIWAR
jgi:hypothetical protein